MTPPRPGPVPRDGLRAVTLVARGDCLHLLRQRTVGRVAYTARALPVIRTVAYRVVDDDVVLQTRSDELADRLDGQVVAFTVDEDERGPELGWSVDVTGLAQRQAALPQQRAGDGRPQPAAVPEQDRQVQVRIVGGVITGRHDGDVPRPLPPRPAPSGARRTDREAC
ncbi:MAG: hypothetical protein JWN17_1765 [Frankiales bacterium]|nr:hypothetical protein [Frankiales bacterium]